MFHFVLILVHGFIDVALTGYYFRAVCKKGDVTLLALYN